MGSNLNYALVMTAAGIGIPVLAALNASLGQRIGSPVTAAAILFTVAVCCAWALAAIGGFQGFGQLTAQPKYLFLAGLLVVFYVLSITFVAPKFGVGNAVFFVLVGQIISASLIDHFGLFGAAVTELSWSRVVGLIMMAGGIGLTRLT